MMYYLIKKTVNLVTYIYNIIFFFSGVIDRVISELKQILKRDFNKKMIENTAFKSFENWWDEQERKSKVRASYFVISQ